MDSVRRSMCVAMIGSFAFACASLDEDGASSKTSAAAVSTPAAASMECRAECDHWDEVETMRCAQEHVAASDCADAHAARMAKCGTLTGQDCSTPELLDGFAAVDRSCKLEDSVASHCVSDVLVAVCANGATSLTTCDASQCGGAMPQPIGCRIGPDDQAYCQCGCEDDKQDCVDGTHVQWCAAGQWVVQICNQDVCDAAGLGASLGCGERDTGMNGCACADP